ncbi:MAG: gliding motility-associated ABC transporter substrate-binding protein GldG, partial [Bacteroidota bacterium]
LNVAVDSVDRNKKYVPFDYQLNLEDLWFKYGIRIEPNLILDLECSQIPLQTGTIGSKPQFDLFPYYYHPIISPKSKHPIAKSLSRVDMRFPSTIDTNVRTKTDVKKTVLLTSSQYTRIQYPPVTLDFEILRYPPKPEKFNKAPQPVAVLYEGVFPSLYANRVQESMKVGLEELGLEFKAESSPTRMLVVSDGDVIRNVVSRDGEVSPTGFNQFEQRVYANKDFLINAVEYLLDEKGVIEARGKEVKLRLLDTIRATEERGFWQLLNIVLPLVFLAIFGIAYTALRRRRYAK